MVNSQTNIQIDKYTQEDVEELCSDIYFDFFVDLIDSGYIFNLNLNMNSKNIKYHHV